MNDDCGKSTLLSSFFASKAKGQNLHEQNERQRNDCHTQLTVQ